MIVNLSYIVGGMTTLVIFNYLKIVAHNSNELTSQHNYRYKR